MRSGVCSGSAAIGWVSAFAAAQGSFHLPAGCRGDGGQQRKPRARRSRWSSFAAWSRAWIFSHARRCRTDSLALAIFPNSVWVNLSIHSRCFGYNFSASAQSARVSTRTAQAISVVTELARRVGRGLINAEIPKHCLPVSSFALPSYSTLMRDSAPRMSKLSAGCPRENNCSPAKKTCTRHFGRNKFKNSRENLRKNSWSSRRSLSLARNSRSAIVRNRCRSTALELSTCTRSAVGIR
mmetsp:Transcript_90352/g.260328  ORF Transcript_90352/g.260328 Transcript_90352/m.260328 type:complete len:238 (+) Transcript_90352:384-1097(+)